MTNSDILKLDANAEIFNEVIRHESAIEHIRLQLIADGMSEIQANLFVTERRKAATSLYFANIIDYD